MPYSPLTTTSRQFVEHEFSECGDCESDAAAYILHAALGMEIIGQALQRTSTWINCADGEKLLSEVTRARGALRKTLAALQDHLDPPER